MRRCSLEDLDRFRVTGDALHPYTEALRWLRGVRASWDLSGTGSSVRFGHGTWLTVAPLVPWADGLRELLAPTPCSTRRVSSAAGWRLGGWGAGLAAAGLYAAWPLVDQPRQGAWTYQAPVAVAFAAWAASVGGRARLGALLGWAALLHPYSAAVALGAAVWLPRDHLMYGPAASFLIMLETDYGPVTTDGEGDLVLALSCENAAVKAHAHRRAAASQDLDEDGNPVETALALDDPAAAALSWSDSLTILTSCGVTP